MFLGRLRSQWGITLLSWLHLFGRYPRAFIETLVSSTQKQVPVVFPQRKQIVLFSGKILGSLQPWEGPTNQIEIGFGRQKLC